eukprot:9443565-Pyramimonas_sp.AAC.1
MITKEQERERARKREIHDNSADTIERDRKTQRDNNYGACAEKNTINQIISGTRRADNRRAFKTSPYVTPADQR